MRLFLFCTFFLFQFFQLAAQQVTASIKGKVTDKETSLPLSEVTVFILNSQPPLGAVTGADGRFEIKDVPVGRQSLRFSLLGYHEALVSELLITTGRETFMNVQMEEKITTMQAVVIEDKKDKSRANNEYVNVSSRSFSAEEMNRYAGTLNDPARMAQSFAGVVTADDENNQIIVRGNSPRGLLWRMEGVEIPNPNHFAGNEGSTGGGVSMLSSNMLTNTDFYSGAFAAEYGNALSGVFDLNLRKGNSDKWEFTFKAGVLGAEAAIEGPFSKKYRGSYLINYRYSTLDLFALMGFNIGGNVTPKYQDLCFNFYFPTKRAGSFTLFGLGGLSSLGGKAVRDTSAWKTFSDKSEYTQKQLMGMAGVTHLYHLRDNKTYLKSVISYSYTNNRSHDDSLDFDFTPFALSDEKFVYRTLRAAIMLNSKLNALNSIRAGITISHYDYFLQSQRFSFATRTTETLVQNADNTSLAQSYVQWKHRFSQKFHLNSGLHFLFSFLNNKFYIEPRLSGEYRISENHTFSFGTGIHSRIDAVSTYVSFTGTNQDGEYTNKNIDFSRALHLVAGYNFNFMKNFRLKTEAYFQYLFGIPIGTDSANGTFSILNYNQGFVNIPLENSGAGYNYGLELTLEKYFSQHYYFSFTASVFNSQYKAADNIWRHTAYNVNYVFNALGGKEFVVGKKKNNIVSLNAKVIWRGGQRETPIDLAKSIEANETVYQNDRAFSEKLPDYFRIDFGASFRRNKKKYSWEFSFDAQNVINRQNIAARIFNPETQRIETRRNIGIIPVFSWKVEFGI